MSSSDLFPSDVRPRGRCPLSWSRVRPQGWKASTFHGTYEIRPSLRLHRDKICWQRGDGFGVRYCNPADGAELHVPGLTKWFPSIADAKVAIRFHHDEVLRRNRVPRSHRRTSATARSAAARAELRAAIARRDAFQQPGFPLPSQED